MLAGSASAQTITIINPGFEADQIGPGTFRVDPDFPQGWSAYDPTSMLNGGLNAIGVIYPLGSPYFLAGAPEGNNAALVFLSGPVNAEAGLQQTLSAVLTADTSYTLTVAVGNIASGTSVGDSSGGPGIFYDLDGFPGYRIELLAGGIVLASDFNSAGNIPEGEFRTASVNFSVGASHALLGQALGIRLVNLDQTGTAEAPNIEVDFDNVLLTATAIPEPATLAAGAGLAALLLALAARQRRRPNQAG